MALKFLVNSFKVIQGPLLQVYNPTLTKAIMSEALIKKRHFFAAENIEEIQEVLTDSDGKFKYMLVTLKHREICQGTKGCKHIVRGFKNFRTHHDLFKAIESELKDYNLIPEGAGGGYIEHDPKTKRINIYGRSERYGRADHSICAKLLKWRYPFYKVNYECEKERSPFNTYKEDGDEDCRTF